MGFLQKEVKKGGKKKGKKEVKKEEKKVEGKKLHLRERFEFGKSSIFWKKWTSSQSESLKRKIVVIFSKVLA